MSKSRKKNPIIKDKTGRWYNKKIRRRHKQEVKDITRLKDMETYEITDVNTIVDKWDISDYKFRWDRESVEKILRRVPKYFDSIKRKYFNK